MTVKTEVEDIVRGFKVESVDYIAKSFKREEVLSRVQTHLKIEQLIQDKEGLNKKLQDQNNELVESQNQYRVILEKSSDGVFTLDAEVKILSCNARFCSFLEFEINELVGRPIMDIVNSEDHKDINPKIVTYRFADRATVGLKVQFCLNETLPTWQKRKYYSLMLDSYGIWNLPNNKIHDKGKEKTFMGAICIVKNPS